MQFLRCIWEGALGFVLCECGLEYALVLQKKEKEFCLFPCIFMVVEVFLGSSR